MDKTVLSIPLETSLLRQAEETFEQIGLNIGEAVIDFLREMIQEHGPSSKTQSRTFSAELLDAMEEAEQIIAEFDAGIRQPGPYRNAREMSLAMDAEDEAEGLI